MGHQLNGEMDAFNAPLHISLLQHQSNQQPDMLSVGVTSLLLCLLVYIIISHLPSAESFKSYAHTAFRAMASKDLRSAFIRESGESAPQSPSRSKVRCPNGLYNPMVSCYINSSVQALSSLRFLPAYLETMRWKGNWSCAQVLLRLIEHVNKPSDASLNVISFNSLFKFSSWDHYQISRVMQVLPTQQHDTAEYLIKIFDKLDNELTEVIEAHPEQYPLLLESGDKEGHDRAVEKYKAGISNPLRGSRTATTTCTKCDFVRDAAEEGFLMQELSLGQWNGPGMPVTIEQVLGEMTAPELLEGVHCAKCTITKLYEDSTKQSTESTSGTNVGTTVHVIGAAQGFNRKYKEALDNETILKDELWDEKLEINSAQMVDSDCVKTTLFGKPPYSLVLQLKRYIWDKNGEPQKDHTPVILKEFLDLQPYHDKKTTVTSSLKYQLRAIITHEGVSLEKGHYICDKFSDSGDVDEGWYEMNDLDVTPQTVNQVLSHDDAYMLFYEIVHETDYHLWDGCQSPLPEQTVDELTTLGLITTVIENDSPPFASPSDNNAAGSSNSNEKAGSPAIAQNHDVNMSCLEKDEAGVPDSPEDTPQEGCASRKRGHNASSQPIINGVNTSSSSSLTNSEQGGNHTPPSNDERDNSPKRRHVASS